MEWDPGLPSTPGSSRFSTPPGSLGSPRYHQAPPSSSELPPSPRFLQAPPGSPGSGPGHSPGLCVPSSSSLFSPLSPPDAWPRAQPRLVHTEAEGALERGVCTPHPCREEREMDPAPPRQGGTQRHTASGTLLCSVQPLSPRPCAKLLHPRPAPQGPPLPTRSGHGPSFVPSSRREPVESHPEE